MTISLSTIYRPDWWVEGKLQWFLFSVILLHSGQWKVAWTNPPNNESTRLPAVPVKIIIPRSEIGKPNCTPVMPITVAPKTDPNVPNNDMPPEVPFATVFNLVIWVGFQGLSKPISLAHVSAVAAAIAARYRIKSWSFG